MKRSTYEKTLKTGHTYYDIQAAAEQFDKSINDMPYTIRVLLENILRTADENQLDSHIKQMLNWDNHIGEEIEFYPARIILQDYTGVPCVVDLASMRDAAKQLGLNPEDINPEIPVDLVIDHSVQVDCAGVPAALAFNTKREFERNGERYRMLKWAQESFDNFTVIPPDNGIVHQINMEYLAKVVQEKEVDQELIAYPDSVFGTDSHTTMINAIGVLGWGVGGIEAEACMLGAPSTFSIPEVYGIELINELPSGVVATDLALTVAKKLRDENVVGKFVEFFGPGLDSLTIADRATIANMSPEHGSTCGFFPIDSEVINYLSLTGRDENDLKRIEAYAKENHFWYDHSSVPKYTKVITLDLSQVTTSISGPKRPQDVVSLEDASDSFTQAITYELGNHGYGLDKEALDIEVPIQLNGKEEVIKTGDILIAAITSCTNTSNPAVLIGAGLLAKKAVEAGLKINPKVKTSFAPGSQTVTQYLDEAKLLPYLDKLGFNIIGYGCTTCIGNSGPLHKEIEEALSNNKELITVNVLSGNRNFESRIHPLTKSSYLASPILVVAYALAGNLRVDITKDPLGYNDNNEAVYLSDIWPESSEIDQYVSEYIHSETFKDIYKKIFDGTKEWDNIDITSSQTYDWEDDSTYIANPPYFDSLVQDKFTLPSLKNMKVLAKLGDSVTTDHISPAGSISSNSPAGEYLTQHGVKDFNTYGARRGHHEVMTRGTLANLSLRNQLVPGVNGGYTSYFPTDETLSIYDASQRYWNDETELIILAGKDYGMGSSRDWAAKGVKLLGVRAVIAESYERIHRSNLAMMGILPLTYISTNAEELGLDGTENFNILLPDVLEPEQVIEVEAITKNDKVIKFQTQLQFISQVEIDYYNKDGILPQILNKKVKNK